MTPEDKERKQNPVDDETRDRREFLKRIGKGSAAVPAAVLLLASAKPKPEPQAAPSLGCGSA